MIFDNLSLVELLNMSSTNDYYRQLGADVFRRKFGAKSVDFHAFNHSKQFEINESDSSIKTTKLDVILRLLKNFGHVITTLHIDFSIISDRDRQNQIIQYVSKYCSESLLELYLEQYRGFELDLFSMPFKKLHKLSI